MKNKANQTVKGIVFNIKRFAIHDGPGIRTTVFLKGCNLNCHWCHNPESQTRAPLQLNGKTVGEEKTVEQVMLEIEKEVLFYDESNGGVTFSGGDPLCQHRFLEALLDNCRAKDIHTTVDTGGNVPPESINGIAQKADLFFYDLKLMDNDKHLFYTGDHNTRTLKNLEKLSKKAKAIVIRFPVVPGITDTDDNIIAMAQYVANLPNIKRVDLLPYHGTAEAKYNKLKMEFKMKGVKPPTPERMTEVKKLFEKYAEGININIEH